MKEIKFLAYYNTPDNAEAHSLSPAACNKVGYVVHALTALERDTVVITASRPERLTGNPEILKRINGRSRLVILPEIPGGNWLTNKISTAVHLGRFCGYLLKKLRKEDVLIVYHSLQYMGLVQWLKEKIGFRLILEVEEIYGDVMQDPRTVRREMAFFQCADGYIFPTEQLNRKVNTQGKPCAIAHGTYQAEPELEGIGFEDGEGRIHVVYAGTFDPRKGGALAAIGAAEHLPARYHMHILGFGSDEEVKTVREQTEAMSGRCACRVSYDGCLSGEAYQRFIQSCHIGLSTQNPAAAFNDTSFPSKVLSYMANGLRVVSIRIPVVEQSRIGDLVRYYDEQTPEQIAKAITGIDLTEEYDSRSRIRDLDVAFQGELQRLLERISAGQSPAE